MPDIPLPPLAPMIHRVDHVDQDDRRRRSKALVARSRELLKVPIWPDYSAERRG